MAFIAQARSDQLSQLIDRLLGVGSFRDENELVAAENLQSHERRDTARVGRALALLHLDLAFETLRHIRENSSGTHVQAGLISDENRRRGYDGAFRWRCRFRCAIEKTQCQDGVIGRFDPAGSAFKDTRGLTVTNDDFREKALGSGSELVEIEIDEWCAGLNLVSLSNAWSKSSPFQRDRINANVHQHFHAISRPES
jgi:hypothetical protein